MLLPFQKKHPKIHPRAFIAPGSHVIGDVTLAADVSIWFGAVLRGDLHAVRVGAGTNVQDNAVLHVDHDKPCLVGKGVIIGHQATVHACRIGDYALIGIGARILSGARIGAYSLIGAGAVVLENAVIPECALVLGIPGKVVRILSKQEAAAQKAHARCYVQLSKIYKKYLG